MASVFADTNCNWKWFTKQCSGKKACITGVCNGLYVTDANLYEQCRQNCQADTAEGRPKSFDEFVCKLPLEARLKYGLNSPSCPTKKEDSIFYSEYEKQQQRKADAVAGNTKLIWGLVGIIVLTIAAIIFIPSNKTKN
jgi:hypothetical protein